MKTQYLTRGNGLLEGFLSKKRACIANSLIKENFRNGAILDVGCGSFPYFLSFTQFAQKYAIDRIDAETWTDKLHDEIVFVCHDVEENDSIPFEDCFFDVINMLAVIEHACPDNVTMLIKEIHRILKFEGMLIVTTPMPWTKNILKILSKINVVSRHEIDEHKAAYNAEELSILFRQASFSREKMRFGYFEFFMNMWGVAVK